MNPTMHCDYSYCSPEVFQVHGDHVGYRTCSCSPMITTQDQGASKHVRLSALLISVAVEISICQVLLDRQSHLI